MPQPRPGIEREQAGIPAAPACASCAAALEEPFGWCSNCREAFCLECGQGHFCRESCRAAGCIAGLCVRVVDGGMLSSEWRCPPGAT